MTSAAVLKREIEAIEVSHLRVVCAWCGNWRNDQDGSWGVNPSLREEIPLVSHGICPDCCRQAMAEINFVRPN
jgi:hypothetical protein